jgi:hypothetical protein
MNKTQFVGTLIVANLMATYMFSLPLKAENIGNHRVRLAADIMTIDKSTKGILSEYR